MRLRCLLFTISITHNIGVKCADILVLIGHVGLHLFIDDAGFVALLKIFKQHHLLRRLVRFLRLISLFHGQNLVLKIFIVNLVAFATNELVFQYLRLSFFRWIIFTVGLAEDVWLLSFLVRLRNDALLLFDLTHL